MPETGLCVASGLIFTYTPVFIEGNSQKNVKAFFTKNIVKQTDLNCEKKEITITNILWKIIVRQCPSKTKSSHNSTVICISIGLIKTELPWILLYPKSVMGNPQPFFLQVLLLLAVTASSISRNWRDANHGPLSLWRHHRCFRLITIGIRTIWAIEISSKAIQVFDSY